MRARVALLVAVLAALGYAAFAAGAARQPGAALFEVAAAALALVTAASALLGGALAGRAPRAAWAGVVLLAALAAWNGLSLSWSIAPDRSWEELNRVLAYALLAGVAVALGAAWGRAADRFAVAWLALVCVVALYALGGKVAPGLAVPGLFDLDQTGAVARLRAPLEYWNALGLLCALGAPVAMRMATDREARRAARLAALEALFLLAVVVGLTYSRGGVAAFLVAAAVLTAFGSGRLRGLVALAAACAAAAPPLAVAFGRRALTENGADLGARIHEGRILGAVLLAAALALLAGGAALLRLEPRLRWSGERSRRIFRAGAVAAAVLVLVGAAGLARSQTGLRATIDRAVESFTEVREDRQFDPVRLVSTNSGNRWSWWSEAAGAWADRPLAGWGAGTFALLHLRYRRDQLPVTQAHSMPMQLLAETGIVGLLLAYGAVLALLAAAIARTRALAPGRRRDRAIALLAAGAAWLVHGLYDWDFVIPAVTAPVLVMLGLLAGAAPRRRPPTEAERLAPAGARERPAAGPALVALATLATAAVVASAVLPWLAARKADRAAQRTAAGDPTALAQAAQEADLAARLNPLATRPLFVAAAVAGRRGRLLEARNDLLEAADRAPDDPQVWGRLAAVALELADREGYVQATRRLFELDPLNPAAGTRSGLAQQILAPAAGSATATGTPLTSGAPAPAAPPG